MTIQTREVINADIIHGNKIMLFFDCMQPVLALVDLGADISAIRSSTALALRKVKFDLASSSSRYVTVADGSRVGIRGSCTLQISLNKNSSWFPCEFALIDSLHEEVILGLDFWQARGARIDLARKRVELTGPPQQGETLDSKGISNIPSTINHIKALEISQLGDAHDQSEAAELEPTVAQTSEPAPIPRLRARTTVIVPPGECYPIVLEIVNSDPAKTNNSGSMLIQPTPALHEKKPHRNEDCNSKGNACGRR